MAKNDESEEVSARMKIRKFCSRQNVVKMERLVSFPTRKHRHGGTIAQIIDA